jgi:hypothetical protein
MRDDGSALEEREFPMTRRLAVFLVVVSLGSFGKFRGAYAKISQAGCVRQRSVHLNDAELIQKPHGEFLIHSRSFFNMASTLSTFPPRRNSTTTC